MSVRRGEPVGNTSWVQDVLVQGHISSLLFTRTHRSFSANLLPCSHSHFGEQDYSSPVEDSQFLFSNFIAFLSAHFSSLQWHTGCVRRWFLFCIIWALCPTLQIINGDIRTYWPQYFPLERHTGDCSPAWHCTTGRNFKQYWKHTLQKANMRERILVQGAQTKKGERWAKNASLPICNDSLMLKYFDSILKVCSWSISNHRNLWS